VSGLNVGEVLSRLLDPKIENFLKVNETDLRPFFFDLSWGFIKFVFKVVTLLVFLKLANKDLIAKLVLFRLVFLRMKRLKYRDLVDL